MVSNQIISPGQHYAEPLSSAADEAFLIKFQRHSQNSSRRQDYWILAPHSRWSIANKLSREIFKYTDISFLFRLLLRWIFLGNASHLVGSEDAKWRWIIRKYRSRLDEQRRNPLRLTSHVHWRPPLLQSHWWKCFRDYATGANADVFPGATRQ